MSLRSRLRKSLRRVLDSLTPERRGSHSSGSRRPRTRGTLTPRLEPLEDRRMLSATLFVDADAPAGGDGLAWATAYDDLQSALESAETFNMDGIAENDVDAIWIAEGIYKPTAELEPGDSRSASFSLVDGVAVYGGFAGTETALAERDPTAAETILSGDVGIPGEDSDNAYSVVRCGEGVMTRLDGVTVTGGNADGEGAKTGGGVLVASARGLTIADCMLIGNSAVSGGGLHVRGSATLIRSTVQDNTATDAGGIYIGNSADTYGTLTLIDSTVSHNSAANNGGGIFNRSAELAIRNSTLSGNAASGNGGGIFNVGPKECVLSSATVVGNSAVEAGGGVFIFYHGTTTVRNSIVAENTAATDPDLDLATTEADEYSLIGGDPMLGPLVDNGGPTLTHLPLEGSPAIDAGSDEYASTYTDQRGWNRRYGTIDVGAVEAQPDGVPIAYPDGFNLDQDGGPVVCDPTANDELWGQTGATVSISRLPEHGTLLTNPDGTFSYTPAPGFFGTDSLDYVVERGGLTSNETSVVFSVLSPESIVVSTSVDELDADRSDGDLSLREALQMGMQIQFSADLLEQTIILDGGTLEIAADRTILGLGAPFLTIDGNDKYRVFDIAEEAVVTMDGLTVSGGWDSEGGGIRNYGTLTLTNGALLGNTGAGGGGLYNRGTATIADSAISYNSTAYRPEQGGGGEGGMGAGIRNAGMLAVVRCTFVGNAADGSGFGSYTYYGGGALYNHGTMTVDASTIRGNSAENEKGGGIYNQAMHGDATLTITNSTISGNSAAGGGGIYAYGYYGTSTVTITNSTISGNAAGEETLNAAGGIYIRSYNGTAALALTNVTVTENTAGYCGGVFCYPPYDGTVEMDFTNSIIAGNVSESYPDLRGDLSPASGFNFIGGDPMLGPLADNGGPTLTHLPLPGSPVIDAGSDEAIITETDQRGRNRFYGTVDMGAVESHPLLPGDLNLDHIVDSTDLDIIRGNWNRTVPQGSLLEGDPSGDGKVNSADLDIVRANWGATASAAAVDAVFAEGNAEASQGGGLASEGVRTREPAARSDWKEFRLQAAVWRSQEARETPPGRRKEATLSLLPLHSFRESE